MSNKLIDMATVEVELAALRNTLIEMRTAAVSDSGRRSRTSVRRQIARLLCMAAASEAIC